MAKLKIDSFALGDKSIKTPIQAVPECMHACTNLIDRRSARAHDPSRAFVRLPFDYFNPLHPLFFLTYSLVRSVLLSNIMFQFSLLCLIFYHLIKIEITTYPTCDIHIYAIMCKIVQKIYDKFNTYKQF